MMNKGVSMKSHVHVSYGGGNGGGDCDTSNQDTVIVTIHCRDNRDKDVATEKVMSFTDTVHGLYPKPGGPGLKRVWNKIEGWLQHMGVDYCCHGYVFENIRKCSPYILLPHCGPLFLDVHVELANGDTCLSDDVEECTCFGSGSGGGGGLGWFEAVSKPDYLGH